LPDVIINQNGPVTWVTLNRLDALNAVTLNMHNDLQAAFDNFAADESQRICVITGAGERAFCAGSDLKNFGTTYPKNGYAGLAERFDLNKPVIAAVNGFALDGGFEIALVADIIIATETARFGLPEPLVGAVALGGGIHRLVRQIGEKQAMGLLLLGKQIDAQEAHRLGVVNEIVPEGGLKTAVEAWCSDILRGAPISISATKQCAVLGLTESSLEAAIKNQGTYPEFVRWRESNDAVEGIAAFAEKRKPNWTNS